LTTNDVSLIDVGDSQYSFLLAPDGSVIDDVWVYRLAQDRYWMVVNASNNDKDWAWVNAVLEVAVQIDAAGRGCVRLAAHRPDTRHARCEARGDEARVQLALQGPRSRDTLLAMLGEDDELRQTLLEMKRNQIIHGKFGAFDLWLSRTGYTGEPMAFEIFVHPGGRAGAVGCAAGSRQALRPAIRAG
jgi:glycine hydroxymethyltransferase